MLTNYRWRDDKSTFDAGNYWRQLHGSGENGSKRQILIDVMQFEPVLKAIKNWVVEVARSGFNRFRKLLVRKESVLRKHMSFTYNGCVRHSGSTD